MKPSASLYSAVLIQLLAMVGVIGLLGLSPPAAGRMMIVPIDRDAGAHMLVAAIDHGARLVGPGSLPGSYVVEGDRAALLMTMLAHGAALVVAPAAGCGR